MLLKTHLNEGNGDGNTPLHLALKNKNWRMAKAIIENKCSLVNLKNHEGISAYNIICKLKTEEAVHG